MDGIRIDFVSHGNLDEVLVLFDAQLREHQMAPGTNALREAIRTVISDARYGFILLAAGSREGAVGVAYASSLLSFEHGGVSGWLEELYVTPPWRGHGIGSRLLEKVISTAKELGWRAIDLEVDAEHGRAIPLYVRHDFRPQSRSRFYLRL